MREYILVAQDKRSVEHYTKMGDGEWRVVNMDENTACVHFSSIDTELDFDQIYRGVEFPRRIARRSSL